MKQKLLSFLAALFVFTGLALPATAVVPGNAGPVVLDSPRPEEYTLSAAFPNPFNSTTKFNLTVRHRQTVRVEVYNMLGLRVRSLFNGVMDAGETKTFQIDASGLPAGIYLYRVRGDRFTAARQATLVR